MIGILVCVVVASQRAGEYLYGQIKQDEDVETAGDASGGVVVIDAGHGGKDPGKVGINNTLEKDINLIISEKVKLCLEEKGVKVIMTRADENGLSDSKIEDLKTRVSVINENNPILAVSIHQNSYTDESVKGAQVFYFTHSEKGKKAAEIMQTALLDVNPENHRQAKANDTYYMLKKTQTPVIIVECGFLSNYEEAERLNTEEYQQKMADAITKGILEYISQGEK